MAIQALTLKPPQTAPEHKGDILLVRMTAPGNDVRWGEGEETGFVVVEWPDRATIEAMSDPVILQQYDDTMSALQEQFDRTGEGLAAYPFAVSEQQKRDADGLGILGDDGEWETELVTTWGRVIG